MSQRRGERRGQIPTDGLAQSVTEAGSVTDRRDGSECHRGGERRGKLPTDGLVQSGTEAGSDTDRRDGSAWHGVAAEDSST